MGARRALLAFLVLGLTAGLHTRSGTAATIGSGHIIPVHMLDKGGGKWGFEPSAIQAQKGDTVRFIQEDIVPHNVQFKNTPAGADLGAAMMGPFLLKKGDTYDLAIDARFVAGAYAFVCTPHETMGMKGTLEVAAGGSDALRHEAVPPTRSGGIR